MTVPAPFSWDHLNQWNVSLVTVVLLLVAGSVYWTSAQRAAPWPRVRTWCFGLALLVTFVATQSVVGVYDMVLFSDHMIQHLLLIMVAAPLFALAAPFDLARAVGGRRTAAALDSRTGQLVLHPLFGFGLYAVFI